MGDLLQRLNNLIGGVRKNPNLEENIYACMANGCILLTAYLREKGAAGWSSKLHTQSNEPMLTPEQQAQIEGAFAKAPWIYDFLKSDAPKQKGGAGLAGLKLPSTMLPSQFTEIKGLTGEDVSMDKLFRNMLKKTDEMDEFWSNFGYISPGLAKRLNTDLIIPIPNGTPIPFKLPIPLKPLVGIFMIILDSIRLSMSLAGKQSNLLTLVVLLEEVATGNWRQAIMSSLGFISPSGVSVGVIFKYIINAWLFISPSIRTSISKDMYKGGKSLLIGFLLWAITTLPPKFLRDQMEEAIESARQTFEKTNNALSASTPATATPTDASAPPTSTVPTTASVAPTVAASAAPTVAASAAPTSTVSTTATFGGAASAPAPPSADAPAATVVADASASEPAKPSRALDTAVKNFIDLANKAKPDLKFKILKEELIRLSINDIQTLQELIQWPAFICTQEYQNILNPFIQNAFGRLLAELLNIPVDPRDKNDTCGPEPYASLAEVVASGASQAAASDAVESQVADAAPADDPAPSAPPADEPAPSAPPADEPAPAPAASAPPAPPTSNGGSKRRPTRRVRRRQGDVKKSKTL